MFFALRLEHGVRIPENVAVSVLQIYPHPLIWWHAAELVCVCVSSRIALEAEGELFKSLAEKEPTFAGISHYLSLSVFLPLSKSPARRL